MSHDLWNKFLYEMWYIQWPMQVKIFLAAFGYYLYSKNCSVCDLFYVLSHFFVATYFLINRYQDLTLKMLLGFTLVSLWSIRLGHLFYMRIKEGTPDPRLVWLGNKYKYKKLFFFVLYQMNAVVIVMTSSCFFWLFQKPNPKNGTFSSLKNTILFAIGFLLALRGIVYQAVADWQLETWKNDKAELDVANQKKGKKIRQKGAIQTEVMQKEVMPNVYVPGPGGHSIEELCQEELRKKFYLTCIEGEWARCRHPNFLHEIEFWFGIALCS